MSALLGLMPDGPVKRTLLSRLLGWQIHPTARVRPCVFFRVQHVVLGPHAQLRSFSVYRDLGRLALEGNSIIGSWNWVSAAPSLRAVGDEASGRGGAYLEMGRDAAVTSRHYIDCSGGVEIGAFSVLAGVRSSLVTHQVDTEGSRQVVVPVTIGDYCLVSSNVKIAPGARIPDRSVVAMGAVVVGDLGEPGMLYAGVPARRVKEVGGGAFFARRDAGVQLPDG